MCLGPGHVFFRVRSPESVWWWKYSMTPGVGPLDDWLIVTIGVIGFWGCVACYCIADEDRILGERRRRDAAIDAAIAAAAADDADDVEN